MICPIVATSSVNVHEPRVDSLVAVIGTVPSRRIHISIFFVATLLLPTLASCEDKKPVLLGITGYNYTDRYIDSFSGGGQGGGNVFLSTAMSGGGKTSCCIGYNPRRSLPIQMKVEWTWGRVEDSAGNVVNPDEHAEATADLRGPVPTDPQNLEVHFMPDRTVELRITERPSQPLLVIAR
jgi:hypothetical protein